MTVYSFQSYLQSAAPAAAAVYVAKHETMFGVPYIVTSPRRRLRSIVMKMSVCLSVCLSVRQDISGTTRAILSNFCACCLGSVLLRRRCDKLYTSGFVDDIMLFSIMGRIAV